MQKVRKTAAELDAMVRAEAVRVIGPWPVGLRLLIFPLGNVRGFEERYFMIE